MTVEASLVMPLVLGGIIFLIYLGMYIYQASVIDQITYIAALRGSQLTKENFKETESYVVNQMEKLLVANVLGKNNFEKEVKVSNKKINVKVNVNMPFIQNLFPKEYGWIVEGKAEATRIKPVDIIREVRRAHGSQISK